MGVRVLDIVLAQIAAVEQMLSHGRACSLLHLEAHWRAQPHAVAARVADLHAHDGAALRIAGKLHVYGGVEAPVGIFITRASASVVLTRG